MNIYNKNKKHWSQVQNEMMGCLHMRMLKNVCLHVISITLSLFGSLVRCCVSGVEAQIATWKHQMKELNSIAR